MIIIAIIATLTESDGYYNRLVKALPELYNNDYNESQMAQKWQVLTVRFANSKTDR